MGPEYYAKKQGQPAGYPQQNAGLPDGYAYGGKPLPNDGYGDAHRQVQDSYSQGLNDDIARFDATDSNLQGYDQMYGGAKAGGGGFDRAYSMLEKAYGPDMAMEVVDDLMRLRADNDVHGPRQPPQMNLPPAPGVPQPEAPQENAFQRSLTHR